MSEALLGKVNIDIEQKEDELINGCFTFKKTQFHESIIQATFKKDKNSNNTLSKIILHVKNTPGIIQKLLSGEDISRIDIPGFKYSSEIINTSKYLIEKHHNYGYVLTIEME
tara:strand:+ start:148 stop:483 length:336 start_codon:yes stop_codon:yes gene_type:complete